MMVVSYISRRIAASVGDVHRPIVVQLMRADSPVS